MEKIPQNSKSVKYDFRIAWKGAEELIVRWVMKFKKNETYLIKLME
jgi:hypothetical protein